MKLVRAACIGCGALLLVGGYAAGARADEAIISSVEAAATVDVMNVATEGNTVTGLLVNNSDAQIHNVQMLVHHTWLWSNERHPGAVSPGRTDLYMVAGPIPPHASLPFRFVGNPLPDREDGSFVTSAEVIGFTQVGGFEAAHSQARSSSW